MRVLGITSLFPNAAQPLAAPFNRQKLLALSKLCELHLLAPVLTFPGARFAGSTVSGSHAWKVPKLDTFDGLPVKHPRALYLPSLQGALGVPAYAASLLPEVLGFRGKVDVVLSSWAHPDGCAAPLFGKLLRVPSVVIVQGSDIDLYRSMPLHRYWLRALLPRAAGVVTVSRALAREVAGLGVHPDRIHTVVNGVDPQLFCVVDRAQARARLGLDPDARWLLFVANLTADKGARDLCQAFRTVLERLPSARLAVVGKGPVSTELAALGPNVSVLGARPLEEIPLWMGACDVLTLPSHHEGSPNVVIEALKCGRRVVATNVGGIPDLITDDMLGELVPPKNPTALADALYRALTQDYDAEQVAATGGKGDWNESARKLLEVLEGVVSSVAGAGQVAMRDQSLHPQ